MNNSVSIDTLLKSKAHWIVRWGITIYCFAIIILIICLTAFYYPSYVELPFKTQVHPFSEISYARVIIADSIADKLIDNSTVDLKYDKNPFKEYGFLTGKMTKIQRKDKDNLMVTYSIFNMKNEEWSLSDSVTGTAKLKIKEKTYYKKLMDILK